MYKISAVFCSACLLVGSAFATGDATYTPSTPSTNTLNNTFLYLNPEIGFSFYKAQISSSSPSTSSGALASGLNVGYQFTNNLALETGFHYFFNTKWKTPTLSEKVGAWAIHAAFKFRVNVIPKTLYLFSKAGGVYIHQTGKTKTLFGKSYKGSAFVPMLALGMDYSLSDNWDFTGSWTFYASKVSVKNASASTFIPGQNILLAGLSYRMGL